jgi:flagellar assembly factor FliW
MNVFILPMYNHKKWHTNHVLNPKRITKCDMKSYMIYIIMTGIIGFIICKQCFFSQICEVGGLVIIHNMTQSNLAIG